MRRELSPRPIITHSNHNAMQFTITILWVRVRSALKLLQYIFTKTKQHEIQGVPWPFQTYEREQMEFVCLNCEPPLGCV